MSPDPRPWYVTLQQDTTHPFRPTFHHGDCAHCLGGADVPAHVRAREALQFKEVMA